MIIFNEQLAIETGLHFSGMTEGDKTKFLSGNLIPEGIEPFAQAYAGHQFGNFTMLGDGRAIVLGEHLTSSGERLDIQLKAQVEPLTPAEATDGPQSGQCFGNT